MAIPIWLEEKLFLKDLLIDELVSLGGSKKELREKVVFSEHHLSHAASAFFPSPFDDAVVLTMDGVGEWATTSLAVGHGNSLQVQKEIHFPHSLGLLYSAFTYYTGFKVNSGEYKVMGLAPYGEPRFVKQIRDHLLDLKADGSFRLNMDYFDYCTGLRMTNSRFDELFGGPPRKPEDRLTQREMDLAASVQAVTEEVILRLVRSMGRESVSRNLCLAGGVALNCVANGKVLRDGAFKDIWVQPAAGDAGGALGAALTAYHLYREQPRKKSEGTRDRMNGAYLGPEFGQGEIEERCRPLERVSRVRGGTDQDGRAIPRRRSGSRLVPGTDESALERSAQDILGDARSPTMQSLLNLKVSTGSPFDHLPPPFLERTLLRGSTSTTTARTCCWSRTCCRRGGVR